MELDNLSKTDIKKLQKIKILHNPNLSEIPEFKDLLKSLKKQNLKIFLPEMKKKNILSIQIKSEIALEEENEILNNLLLKYSEENLDNYKIKVICIYLKNENFDFSVGNTRDQIIDYVAYCEDLKIKPFFIFEGFEFKMDSLFVLDKQEEGFNGSEDIEQFKEGNFEDYFNKKNLKNKKEDLENFQDNLKTDFDFEKKNFNECITKNNINKKNKNNSETKNIEKIVKKYDTKKKIPSLKSKNYITNEKFKDILFKIQLQHGIDFDFTETATETISILSNILTFLTKKKTNHFQNFFDSTKIGGNSKSKIMGINQKLELTWINILQIIPGLSEIKAVAIVKKYPSIKSLISEYEKIGDICKKMDLLKDLKIRKIDGSEKQKIGKVLSKRVYNFLFSLDHNLIL